MLDLAFCSILLACVLVFAIFWHKSSPSAEDALVVKNPDDDREHTLKRIHALYAAYLISWPLIFLYVCHAYQLKTNALYLIPLLWPLFIFARRLNRIEMERRRQSCGEAANIESTLFQTGNVVIGSIIAVALVLGFAKKEKDSGQSRKHASQVIIASIVIALLSLTVKSNCSPEHYIGHVTRTQQSMIVHTSISLFLTGSLMWYIED